MSELHHSAIAALAMVGFAGAANAVSVDIVWVSKDESRMVESFGVGSSTIHVNPDGGSITVTTTGAFSTKFIDDRKTKEGLIRADTGELIKLSDASFGSGGEPGVLLAGATTEGQGVFDLSLHGFEEFSDITTSFSASLIGGQLLNPMSIEVFGQGDQLTDGKAGSINFLTRWSSSDVIPLLTSTGDLYAEMVIGDFVLESKGEMNSFSYRLTTLTDGSPAFFADFTSDENYTFLFDGLGDPTDEANIRGSQMAGVVTKSVTPIPIPASGALMLSGLAALSLFGRRKRLKEA